MGFAISAMLKGNTVVLAPSGLVPMPVYSVYSILETAHLPGGVLNLITDKNGTSAKALAENTELAGIAFSGSGCWPRTMFTQMNVDLTSSTRPRG